MLQQSDKLHLTSARASHLEIQSLTFKEEILENTEKHLMKHGTLWTVKIKRIDEIGRVIHLHGSLSFLCH